MKNTFRKLAFGLGLAIATITAHAELVPPLVSLQENVINDENGNWLMNQYVVTNNSYNKNEHILAFGVTNPSAQSVWTTREYWSAMTLSREEWNSGVQVKSGLILVTGDDTNSSESNYLFLGRFESLFGTEENFVNFFWMANWRPIGPGEASDEFFFSAPTASQYAAFGEFGTIFQSFNNVPEPGSMALLGLAALAGLTVTRRRRPS